MNLLSGNLFRRVLSNRCTASGLGCGCINSISYRSRSRSLPPDFGQCVPNVDLNWGWRLDVTVQVAIGDVVKRFVDCRFEEASGIQDRCRGMRPVFIILLSARRFIFQMMDSVRNACR